MLNIFFRNILGRRHKLTATDALRTYEICKKKEKKKKKEKWNVSGLFDLLLFQIKWKNVVKTWALVKLLK